MIRRTGFISHASIFLSCMWQASKAASRLAMSWSSARTMYLGRCWGHQVLSHTSGMASTSVKLSPSGSHTWNTSPKLLLISRGSYPKELEACLTPNSSLSWPQSLASANEAMQTPLSLLSTMRWLRQWEPARCSSLWGTWDGAQLCFTWPIHRLPGDPASLLPVPAACQGSHTGWGGKQEH